MHHSHINVRRIERILPRRAKHVRLQVNAFLLILVTILTIPLPLRAEERRPNIIILLADDLGYGETGCQGNTQIPTPAIDSIAAHGVRFTDAYVTAPFCSASRAGLLTGRWQARFGYEFNPIGAQNEDPAAGLPPSERTIADHLHDAGYYTGLIGKWHLGGTARYHPYRRGFDEFYGFLHEGHYYVSPPYANVTTWLRRKTLPDRTDGRWVSQDGRMVFSNHLGYDEPDYDADNPILRGGQPVDEHAFLTDAITRESVSFIERNADRPFFLLVAYNAVHSPMQATDPWIKRFGHIEDVHRRIFAAMLGHLDESVADILKSVDEQNLREDTMVVFLSDNGGPTRELTSSNLPLRGEKGQLYEGGIRVPLLIRWPGKLQPGTVSSVPVTSLDLFPTALSAAQANADGVMTDGVNLRQLLGDSERADHPRPLYWRVGDRSALRLGEWKIVRNGRRGASAPWELYRLTEDIGEERELSGTQPEIADKLINEWERLNGQMIAPVWVP
ncbi:MAG: sulfatase-like hydrolase/transferase [Planctomycetaceae bacterium]|nr:sulfatase-like hydrolase/transferase [Planctomycetaceae bacterium]